MTDDKGKYAPPFSLRFTVEERLKLDADAGDLAIAEYICSQLFQNPSKRLRPFRRPIQDGKALGEVLAALGRSRLSSNLNQLAKAVHSGSLPVTPETEKAILEACASVQVMSSQLVNALGLPDDKNTPPKGGVS
ncbi:MAG: hypothetical protein PSY14_00700 [bacterium]|nr:hypothetical protein [bacterium]